jgi:P4 family phage/plasmid primase-like protien
MSRREESYAVRTLNENGKADAPVTPNPTDQGNALRLVARHGKDLRYVNKWGKWLVWDGKRWRPDDTGEVVRRAKETVRAMFHEADDGGGRIDKELAKHAMKSEARGSIEAMITLAKSEPGIPLTPDQLDRDPWLLNSKNGTINLRTGELRVHSRADLITKITPVEYHPDAEAPTWTAFLEQILPPEPLRSFVQRAIGYAATGEVSEEVLVILYGVGANGKSTLVNAVIKALGDYAMQAAPDLLMAKRGSHPTELADLFGARFVASVEVEEGRRLAESLVKQLTGRDPIKARRMREDFWQFDPTHTVFLATNHRPEVRGTDHAIWRRIKLVPFEVTIPEEKQDKQLPAKLRNEQPGILAWIVRGCREWLHEGLGEPKEVKAATEGYRSEMDVLAAFISDRCVVNPKANVGATPLYNAYKDWCDESGENKLTQTKFGLRLKERGFRNEKAQRVTWHGIGLRDDRPDPDRSRQSGENYLGNEFGTDKPNAEYRDRGLDSRRPESGMTSVDYHREGAISKMGLQPSNYLNPAAGAVAVGSTLRSDNDIQLPSATSAQWEAKEGKGRNTSSNSSLSSHSSASGGAEGKHVVAGPNERLWRERVAELEADCLHGFARGKGCYLCDPAHPAKADEQPRRLGFSDLSPEKGA